MISFSFSFSQQIDGGAGSGSWSKAYDGSAETTGLLAISAAIERITSRLPSEVGNPTKASTDASEQQSSTARRVQRRAAKNETVLLQARRSRRGNGTREAVA